MMTTQLKPRLGFKTNVDLKRVARWVEGCKTATVRDLSGQTFSALRELDNCRLFLNKAFGLNLRAVALVGGKECGEKTVKQFCGGLLDRVSRHAWKSALRESHLGLRERLCVASTLFSVRKVLSGRRPAVKSYVRQMSQAQSPPPARFLAYCRKATRSIFESGWDRKYRSFVEGFTPPTKSNINKAEDGTYREFAVEDSESRNRFLQHALRGGSMIDRKVRAKAVLTGGKWRVVTLSDPRLSHLLPLHRTIYDRLTKEKWLLRGEATEKSFVEFLLVDGEQFVSGDYESATDNLNVHVTRAVLETLLSTATHLPMNIRGEALRSLSMIFVDDDGHKLGVHQRGQLMGSPLSFPLLCLINYLTFKYAVQREVPVKINGDDIVFRATESETADWFSEVSASGLKISVSKTLVHKRIFSLNSQYFIATDTGVECPGHFRWSNIRKCESMIALSGRVARIRCDLDRMGTKFINLAISRLVSLNLHMIYSSQGSFSRRYRCNMPRAVMHQNRLFERESFYRGLNSEPEPIPVYTGWRQSVVPREWNRVTAIPRGFVKVEDSEFRDACVFGSWEEAVHDESKDEWWERNRRDTFRYVPFAKKTFRLFRKFVGVQFVASQYSRCSAPEKVWCKKDLFGTLSSLSASGR